MSSNLKVNSIVPATGTNVAIGTAGGTITYGASVAGVSTFSSGLNVTGGSVGIGTDNPGGNILEVYKDQASNTSFSIKNPSTAAGTYASAYISAGSVNGQIYTDANGNAGLQGMTIQTTSNHGLRFNTNSIERLRIDNVGRVTMPYQPSFRAGRNSNYSPGANIDIIFNTTANSFHHNIGGHYDTSNGRFTCPIAGRYYFTSCIIWGGGLTNQNLSDAASLYVNGSNACFSFRRAHFISGTTGGTDGYYTDHLNCILNLNAGDYVTIRNAYNIQVHGNELYCWFAGYLVG